MDTFINFGMPHVAELIFEYVDVGTLLQIRLVSKDHQFQCQKQ